MRFMEKAKGCYGNARQGCKSLAGKAAMPAIMLALIGHTMPSDSIKASSMISINRIVEDCVAELDEETCEQIVWTAVDISKQRLDSKAETEYENSPDDSNAVERINRHDDIFTKYAEKYGVNKNIIKAIAYTESRGRHWREKKEGIGGNEAEMGSSSVMRGSAGEIGMMQIMPATATALDIDAFDINQNIMGAAKLMSINLRKYSNNVPMALHAYNIGNYLVEKAAEKADSEKYDDYARYIKGKSFREYPLRVLAAKKLFE